MARSWVVVAAYAGEQEVPKAAAAAQSAKGRLGALCSEASVASERHVWVQVAQAVQQAVWRAAEVVGSGAWVQHSAPVG